MLQVSRQVLSPLKRLMSTTQTFLERLNERTLIRVRGQQVADFLQGLITNDMKHLESGPGAMYAMFLNSKGRIMYDTIVYRPAENDTFLLECDKEAASLLEKHLKMFRVRRKIDITILDQQFKIYALFNNDIDVNEIGKIQNLLIFRDPRVVQLGFRIVAKSDLKIEEQVGMATGNGGKYRRFRYSLGIGEGILDLPPNNSFPLECNCDYLHGVSFQKGCYIGQELTARVHHTGVVRKRLVPLNFSKIPSQLPEDNNIIFEGENLGKLRGIENNAGLGLLRIAKAMKFDEIKIGDGIASVHIPEWWPVEAPKDKISLHKL